MTLYIRDNLGNEAEADNPAAAGKAVESFFFDGGGRVTTVTVSAAFKPDDLEEQFHKIVEEVRETFKV